MLARFLTAGLAVATLATAMPAAAQSSADEARFRAAQDRFRPRISGLPAGGRSLSSGARPWLCAAPPPAYDNGYRRAPDVYTRDDAPVYDPARDYRDGTQYRERVVSPDERVYAGYDGRYYCKRSDGTTG